MAALRERVLPRQASSQRSCSGVSRSGMGRANDMWDRSCLAIVSQCDTMARHTLPRSDLWKQCHAPNAGLRADSGCDLTLSITARSAAPSTATGGLPSHQTRRPYDARSTLTCSSWRRRVCVISAGHAYGTESYLKACGQRWCYKRITSSRCSMAAKTRETTCRSFALNAIRPFTAPEKHLGVMSAGAPPGLTCEAIGDKRLLAQPPSTIPRQQGHDP